MKIKPNNDEGPYNAIQIDGVRFELELEDGAAQRAVHHSSPFWRLQSEALGSKFQKHAFATLFCHTFFTRKLLQNSFCWQRNISQEKKNISKGVSQILWNYLGPETTLFETFKSLLSFQNRFLKSALWTGLGICNQTGWKMELKALPPSVDRTILTTSFSFFFFFIFLFFFFI